MQDSCITPQDHGDVQFSLQLGAMSVIFEDTKYSLKITNVRLIWVAWSIIVDGFQDKAWTQVAKNDVIN